MMLRKKRQAKSGIASIGLLLGLLVVGCQGGDATAHIELALQDEAASPRVGPATIPFHLTDTQTGEPVTNAEVQVEANMTHPGMAPSRAEAIEVTPGEYKAEIDYTMRGDWYLLFDVRLPDGQTFSRQVHVAGVTE